MKFILALCAVIAGTSFLKHLAKIKKQSYMTDQQRKQMNEYSKLLVTPGWIDVDIYPFTDKAYERLWQELKEDHGQGKHKVHHYIDCVDCREEYNNENENS